ncbi:MAG TPA: PQQ-binding-like beta-propeller repeat protein, partial [Lacipirellulaceae bacterium]|nr:PQQ-binding-like beta-propeller repeat protein [Lacipirellulaceae bacterium]
PAASLDVAQQVITAGEHDPAFVSSGAGEQGLSEAKQELGRLLVRIGEALIAEAEEAADAADVVRLIEKTEAVLALSANNKYVPEQVRNQPALAEISESLAVIRARQQRDSRLAATLTKMDQAVSAGDTSAAYAERLTLLAEFPALADHESRAAKVREVSAAEQAGVRFVAGERPAETSWPARAVVAELALAERRPLAAGPQPGAPVVVRVDGALYGLASGDGALLWRRFAGFGSAGAPLMIGGDVVAANLEAGELWRLNASTGKLVWRLPLEDQITGVVAAGARLLATAASGKLFVVNAADGALAGHVEFTQPIRTAPAVNERGDRIYVIAEHSIAYTLSGDDFSCIGVYYLGHAAGAVLAPPIALLNKVVVADNSGSDGSRLRVLTLDGRGVPDKEAASDRLAGIITTPLARAGRRLAAVTARGQVAVVEVSGAADQSALINVARREGQEPEALARFALLHDGKLWLAARQLSKLAILPTENQLSVESLDRNYLGSAFDGLLQSAGKLVIHVHRPAGRAGAVVAATDSATNRAVWETAIAVPLATAPMVDASRGRIVATTASGAAFILDRQALARGVQDASSRAVGSVGDGAPLTLGVAAPDGRQLVGALGSSQILLVAPDEPRPVRTIQLASPLSGPLAAWGGGALAPTEVGQVFAIPAGETSDAITPFQPQLVPGRKYAWLEPSAVGAGEAPPFLVSDGAERLYLVELRAEGTRYFQEAKSVDVGPAPLATPLVVVGSVALAGTGDGRLARFALPDLAPSEPVELGGQVAWGPFPVAVEGSAAALLATDADELMLISQEGAVRWRRPLAHGPLSGKPLVAASGIFTLSGGGGIARIDPADGTEVGFADLHQPATVGPVPLGERLLVAGPDGGLMVVNRP